MPEWLLDFLGTYFVVTHPLTGEWLAVTYQQALVEAGRLGLALHSAWWPRLEAMWPALESIFDFYRP